MGTIIRLTITILVISGLAAAVYLLWQRQPKASNADTPVNSQIVLKNEPRQEVAKGFISSPIADEVSGSTTVKIAGQTGQAVTALVYSNSTTTGAVVITPEGKFAYDALLQNGLNLVQVAILDSNLKETQSQNMPIYVSKTDADKKLSFKAGIVKKIFENTLTVTTSSGDVDITTNSSTIITNTAPPTQTKSPPPKSSADNDVRVGDYIVAVGEKDKNNLKAQKIEIYRDNKPAVGKTYAVVKIASPAKSNIFSGTNQKDSKLLEFTLDKNSQIFDKDKKTNALAILKDKTAIVIYSDRDDGLVSSIYLQ